VPAIVAELNAAKEENQKLRQEAARHEAESAKNIATCEQMYTALESALGAVAPPELVSDCVFFR